MLVGLTILVDIVYMIATIKWMGKAPKDHYLAKVNGLNMYGLVITVLEIILKVGYIRKVGCANREVNLCRN